MDLNKKNMTLKNIPDSLFEFEKKSLEFQNLVSKKKELPDNFLETYPVYVSKESEDLYLKIPSYSLKVPSIENNKIETIKTLLENYQLKENFLIEYSYETNELNNNMFVLSIDIGEEPLERNLIVTQKLEEILNNKGIYFYRKNSYFEKIIPKNCWKKD